MVEFVASLFAAGFIVVTSVIAGFIFYFVDAVVLKVMWGWFIVEQFGLPPITWQVAMGLCLVVGLLNLDIKYDLSNKPGKEDLNSGAVVFGRVFAPLFILLLGWVIKQFM